MIYSCFDQQRGNYRYFQDGATHPVNADLPVPSLGTKTKLGYASIDSARPLPSSAKPAGSGWHARGQVVRCPGDVSALGVIGLSPTSHALILIATGAAIALVLKRYW